MIKKILLGVVTLSLLWSVSVFALFHVDDVGQPIWEGDESYYKVVVGRCDSITGELSYADAYEAVVPITIDLIEDNDDWSIKASGESMLSYMRWNPEIFPSDSIWRQVSSTKTGHLKRKDTEDRKVVWSNYDVYTKTGELVYSPKPTIPEGDYFVKFLLPRDGFEDNSYLGSFNLYWQVPWQPGLDTSEMEIQISGGDNTIDFGEAGAVTRYKVYEDDDGWTLVGFMDFARGLNVGENEIIAKIVIPLYEYEIEGSVNVTRLGGFIDENGDGLDDRTGRTDSNTPSTPIDYENGFSENPMPKRSDFEEGFYGDMQFSFAWLMWFLTYPFYAIGGLFSMFSKAIAELFQGFDEFIEPLKKFVSWLPTELKLLVTAVFSLTIVTFIFKR